MYSLFSGLLNKTHVRFQIKNAKKSTFFISKLFKSLRFILKLKIKFLKM